MKSKLLDIVLGLIALSVTVILVTSYFINKHGMEEYHRGIYDANTELMSSARFGSGEVIVESPNFIATYKLKKLENKEENSCKNDIAKKVYQACGRIIK